MYKYCIQLISLHMEHLGRKVMVSMVSHIYIAVYGRIQTISFLIKTQVFNVK